MKPDTVQNFEKTDSDLANECKVIIDRIFGGLDKSKSMALFNVYKQAYTDEGLQPHHYQDVIEKMKPVILALKDTALLEINIKKSIDVYKKQKWNDVFKKLEIYRGSKRSETAQIRTKAPSSTQSIPEGFDALIEPKLPPEKEDEIERKKMMLDLAKKKSSGEITELEYMKGLSILE
jgi:hypothetical protein